MSQNQQAEPRKLSFDDFQQLCRTYCGDVIPHVTTKAVERCWANEGIFANKGIGYRFKCQCPGNREAMRVEGCGMPPIYSAPPMNPKGNFSGESSVTKIVTTGWKQVEKNKSKNRVTQYDFFKNVCEKFCDANDESDYSTNRYKIKSLKWALNTSKFKILNARKYNGELFNCMCRRNKEERLSVSDGL